jgi:hypothetical protein
MGCGASKPSEAAASTPKVSIVCGPCGTVGAGGAAEHPYNRIRFYTRTGCRYSHTRLCIVIVTMSPVPYRRSLHTAISHVVPHGSMRGLLTDGSWHA